VLIIEGVAKQRVQPCGQLIEGEAVTLEHAADHGLDRHAAFHIVATRGQLVVYQRVRQRVVRRIVLGQAGKGFEELLEKTAFDVFALQAQVAHGLEKDVLFDVVARPVSHFKERVIGVIEQLLQTVAQLLGSLVANLKQNHRQAGERRVIRLIGSSLVQRHYFPVVVHPGLLKR
jgi:hypothetical protein